MIHYHGTPLGGAQTDVARILPGRHAMVSFAAPRDVSAVASMCSSFVLDNGAFSIWKQGGTLDCQTYVEWVREWYRHPAFDWALIPDVIEGDEAENDAHIAWWKDNAADIAGVPVWHFHESLDRLVTLAEAWPIVALGSSGQWPNPGTRGWWQRMAEAMDVVCDEMGRPICKLHGLRMLNPNIFTRLPLRSADSTNVARNGDRVARFGCYTPPTRWQRANVIADRIEVHASSPVFMRDPQGILW
jgi:hypothetical protein